MLWLATQLSEIHSWAGVVVEQELLVVWNYAPVEVPDEEG